MTNDLTCRYVVDEFIKGSFRPYMRFKSDGFAINQATFVQQESRMIDSSKQL